jgi:multicomponent Na+:H+ antiporter subunit F
MNIFEISLTAAIIILSLCLILTMVRFLKGPSLPDRVTAFDLFASNIIGITAIYAVLTANTSYLDVAIILALIAFLGSMSFAYYLLKRLEE